MSSRGYDYDLICVAVGATNEGYTRTSESTLQRVNEILDGLELEQYNADWEKVFVVQKWVKEHIKYDFTGNASVQKALDTGYAQLMLVMCRALGIPCYIVEDPDYMNGAGHAWNIVLVDGLWCTMDLTDGTGFGWMCTGDFMQEPNKTAVAKLSTVYVGRCVDETGLFWDCADECWVTE